ncbi:MAG: alpha/beta fold hydrolase [Gammaproteobacteria bacterium]|nr:alpha/beta fold hydrolase [Gammaproteobacteria bacterium]
MAQLQVKDLQIEYDTFGAPGADPILLIMGLGMQMTAWTPQFCNTLAGHGHYVIRFDNRDIGLSTKFDHAKAPSRWRFAMHHFLHVPLKAPYSLEDMASDAAGVLEALGIESAHVVGASMGGMIAQLMTVRFPRRVASLTSLMSSSGHRKLPRPSHEVIRHVVRNRPKNGSAEDMIEYLVKTFQMIGSPRYRRSEEEWRELISAGAQRSFCPQGVMRQMAAIVADGSRVERLEMIDRPALVIHGRDDPLVPVECGIDTARHIKGARLEIIEGMGHDIPPPLVDSLTSLIANHARTS